ncbi:DNA-3-methyladenine glycosylase family protein [Clostridium oryzae]|uniref:DNA-(apurinic or apyrimidinic site) lyase n=1 Tax=Clostridium oryzae TaxID=1450648 RepID=A0A1V4IP02_9CLOT|nr:DNA glycosylase [Clostridium oryzae]OPJ61525.1 DNA-3-methyladenine glycosylase [Clostridium oryzae]
MDYDRIEVADGSVIIKSIRNFELAHIFECGQCFRWNKISENKFIGVACEKVLEVEKNDEDVILHNCTEQDFYSIWEKYFDLKREYGNIKEELSKDPLLKKSVDFGYGIRLLQQQPFEIILSFIISANNRIPMIKRTIEKICDNWGNPIEYNGKVYHTFPKLEVLSKVTEEELESCGMGFRAKYVKDTVDKIFKAQSGEDDFQSYKIDSIVQLNDDGCHDALQKFNGIGPKVADCIMLFSMGKYSAFPVDVWVKRAMMHFYVAPDVSLIKIRNFGREKFGKLSGFAQQYLFYYARENNIKI